MRLIGLQEFWLTPGTFAERKRKQQAKASTLCTQSPQEKLTVHSLETPNPKPLKPEAPNLGA